MKLALGKLIILFGLIAVTQSCKKESNVDPLNQTINQTIGINQAYQFDLGNFGDEEGASIYKQATNFSISTVEREINTGKVLYKYVPAPNFVGIDEVKIKSARGTDGASPNNNIIYTTIKLTVTN